MNACRHTLAALAGLVMGLVGCEGTSQRPSTLELTDCRLPKLSLTAKCGELTVLENRDQPDGRKIVIAVAVLPANTLNPRADPLFIVAGGPGQAASFLGPFAASLTGVRKDRDIVLIDQRGTGRSSPLDCAPFKPDPSLDTALEFDPAPKAMACAKELAARGVDVTQYTTLAWIADLDAVRAAIGYAKINLWGGSYGTRAALEYLRKHPDRVRSVVLDGVEPPSMRSTLDVWPTRDVALTAVLDACAQSPACAVAHHDLPTTLAGIRDRLGRDGRDFTVTDPHTGEPQTQRITFDHVLGALLPLTYSPELSVLLPEIIGRAAADDFAPMIAAALYVTTGLDEQMNTALHYSVTCAEDIPRVSPADATRVLANLPTKALAERALAVCNEWPKGMSADGPPLGARPPGGERRAATVGGDYPSAADATTPVSSTVPVLILSGGLDPVTPPANGSEVAKTLPNSRHIIARGYGHIVSPHACGPRLIAAFVDDPSFATLPESCVNHFEKSVRPPLWPDRLGARS